MNKNKKINKGSNLLVGRVTLDFKARNSKNQRRTTTGHISQKKSNFQSGSKGDTTLTFNDKYSNTEESSKIGDHYKTKYNYHHAPKNGGCFWIAWVNLIILIGVIVWLIILSVNTGDTLARDASNARDAKEEFSLRSGADLNEIRHAHHNHTKQLDFIIDAKPGSFSRYPADESKYIDSLDPDMMVEYRLCCHINHRLFVCDYGQGASQNIGLECAIEYTQTGKAFLRINIQSKEMNGSKCTLTWKTGEPKDILEQQAQNTL